MSRRRLNAAQRQRHASSAAAASDAATGTFTPAVAGPSTAPGPPCTPSNRASATGIPATPQRVRPKRPADPRSVDVWAKKKRRRGEDMQEVVMHGLGRALRAGPRLPSVPPSPAEPSPAHPSFVAEDGSPLPGSIPPGDASNQPKSNHQRKREQTTGRWQKLLPSLHAPFMRLMQETQNLSLPPRKRKLAVTACTCHGRDGRKLSILVLHMSSVNRVEIVACECRPAAVQLIEMGLFPSSPCRPTLAIDINVLDFVRILFVNISPNVRAWCKASEQFLRARNHKLNYSDNMRKRFGNALLWFTQLHAQVRYRTERFLDVGRRQEQRGRVPSAMPSSTADEGEDHRAQSLAPPPSTVNQPRQPSTSQDPSQYLRARCPLCFGSGRRHSQTTPEAPDCVVALDACFSQKHNKQRRDPEFLHPDDAMIKEETLEATEAWLNGRREGMSGGSRPRRGHRPAPEPASEGAAGPTAEPFRLPPESLAKCENSFKAAQTSIAKASCRLHDVTAAMALLCRHDVPLFWANMSSAGEKQYYVVALMNALVAHLPKDWTIGFLYDIACQTHASALKHGIFDGFAERIKFAVSVFHAYGHDLPCQSLYHPRKRVGFGLSDGEGCERFWYAISKFISYLRVAGYHLRLYTLNIQMLHLSHTSLEDAGIWLARKQRLLTSKLKEAQGLLAESGRGVEYLREQWRLQVVELTKPGVGSAKDVVRREVEAVLELERMVKNARKAVEEAKATDAASRSRSATRDPRSDSERLADVAAAEASLRAAETKYAKKLERLGVDARAKVGQMRQNKALHCRAKGLVLLGQARSAVMKRQMEMEQVARIQRNKNAQNALRHHVSTAVDRRAGTLRTTVRKYNETCRELQRRIDSTLKRQGKCSVRPLTELPDKGIWKLDIDNPCWDDLRYDLDDSDDAPQWMVNPKVRQGIRAMLVIDRCEEERQRLRHEEDNLRLWFKEEWGAIGHGIQFALAVPDAPALIHQLQERRKDLLRLAVKWRSQVPALAGPTNAELAQAAQQWSMASCDVGARISGGDAGYLAAGGIRTQEGAESDDGEGPGVASESGEGSFVLGPRIVIDMDISTSEDSESASSSQESSHALRTESGRRDMNL